MESKEASLNILANIFFPKLSVNIEWNQAGLVGIYIIKVFCFVYTAPVPM